MCIPNILSMHLSYTRQNTLSSWFPRETLKQKTKKITIRSSNYKPYSISKYR